MLQQTMTILYMYHIHHVTSYRILPVKHTEHVEIGLQAWNWQQCVFETVLL